MSGSDRGVEVAHVVTALHLNVVHRGVVPAAAQLILEPDAEAADELSGRAKDGQRPVAYAFVRVRSGPSTIPAVHPHCIGGGIVAKITKAGALVRFVLDGKAVEGHAARCTRATGPGRPVSIVTAVRFDHRAVTACHPDCVEAHVVAGSPERVVGVEPLLHQDGKRAIGAPVPRLPISPSVRTPVVRHNQGRRWRRAQLAEVVLVHLVNRIPGVDAVTARGC